MALSYTDVYTVAEYGSRVQEIGKEIENQKTSMEGTVFLAGQKIQEQINILQQKEASIFELLGVSNLQQLNMRIQRYQQDTFTFNGSALRSTFTGILETNNQREYRAFEKAVKEVINQDILQDVTNYIEGEGFDKIAEAILNYINIGSSHKYTSTRGIEGLKIFPNSFTKEQKERWKDILKQKAKQGGFPESEKWDLIINNSDTQLNCEFTWFDEKGGTGKRTEENAKNNLSIEDIKKINTNIKEKILECVTCNDKTLLEEIIDEISGTKTLIDTNDLNSANLSFFVGENINKITGVLGEIQGMYYLRKLLGDKAKTIWRGGTKTGLGNADPHQDIQIIDTFKRAFGIQIKNTSSDIQIKQDLGVKQGLNKTINFSEGSISTMVSKMASIVPIDDSIIGLLETYYGTKSFNVEYHRDKRKKKKTQYLPGLRLKDVHAPEFQNFHNQLLGYESQINSLMSLFAAAFMYLDAFDFKNENDANALFLIGGTAFVAASDVLETILNDLISETSNPHFTINMSSNGDNIISALSSGKRKGSSYTNTVLNDIKLTSAYKF